MNRRQALGMLAASPVALMESKGWGAAAHEPVRGVTVSCPTWGWEWGSDEMVDTLDLLAGLGVDWVSIHPYARIHQDGRVPYRPLEPAPEWLTRPVREAQARGMKVMIKPHLAYWGSGFSWRGEIAFAAPDAWARFFGEYTEWVRDLARVTAAADAFVVGTELDRTVSHEEPWREVVAQVRSVHGGKLTYGANWDGFEDVPFWDALDAVGVQAYFPVAKGVAPEQVDAAQLDRGWDPWLARLRAVSERTGKPACSPSWATTAAPMRRMRHGIPPGAMRRWARGCRNGPWMQPSGPSTASLVSSEPSCGSGFPGRCPVATSDCPSRACRNGFGALGARPPRW